jgi:heme exporter protein C
MQVFANPNLFLRIASKILPFAWVITAILFAFGLYGALVTSPPDGLQGEMVRIMYIHVPAATLGLYVYVSMAMLSAIAYVFRHPLADTSAKAAAPIGAAFCFLALATGSLWGKPTWGTWWVWDARLTSMFVLMLLYLGYIAIWRAFDDLQRATELARIVAIVGVINVPIVKYSVDWWNTLHQPASILRKGGPKIDSSMLWPLLTMIAAYIMLFLCLHLMAIRNEVRERKLRAERLKSIGTR